MRPRILSLQGMWEFYAAEASGNHNVVLRLRLTNLRRHWYYKFLWKHRDSVLGALAIAHEDDPLREVDVFDTQPKPFQKSQATPVKQVRNEPRGVDQVLQPVLDFVR